MSPRTAEAAAEVEPRRHGVLGALAAALPERGPRRSTPPDLRVVAPATRRRRGWQVGTVAGLLLFLALFAIAGAHTMIVQQQRHIDDVNARIATAEEEAEALKIDLAELQSPERILAEARDRLGMIQAPPPVYLRPDPADDERAADVPPTTPPTTAPKTTTTTASTVSGSGSGSTTKSTGTSGTGTGTKATGTGSTSTGTGATSTGTGSTSTGTGTKASSTGTGTTPTTTARTTTSSTSAGAGR